MTNNTQETSPQTPAKQPSTHQLSDYATYPNSPTHAWNAFAFLAIEAEGYGDLTATNPYTGTMLHAYAWTDTDSPYQALRNLVDAMETAGFLDPEPETD